MPAPSLQKMAFRSLSRVSSSLTDIGTVPYDLLREILIQIENPNQLRELEKNSPQIIGHDEEIWLAIIKRNIPKYEEKRYRPADPAKWYKVYRKLKKEADAEREQGTEELKAAMMGLKEAREEATSSIIKSRGPGPSMRQRRNYNYISGKQGSRGGSRLTLMEKIKKDARDNSLRGKVTATHDLTKLNSRVAKAPISFVESRQQKEPSPPRTFNMPEGTPRKAVPASRPLPSSQTHASDHESYMEMREARLKALRDGKPAPPPLKTVEAMEMPAKRSSKSPKSPQRKPEHVRFPAKPAAPSIRKTGGALSVDFLEGTDDVQHGQRISSQSKPQVESANTKRSDSLSMQRKRKHDKLFIEKSEKRSKLTTMLDDLF